MTDWLQWVNEQKTHTPRGPFIGQVTIALLGVAATTFFLGQEPK